MQRPIGVTLLAIGAGLAGLLQIWRILVFAGIVNWTFVGREVSFSTPQWGQIFWCVILAAIWFWEAAGFWNVRAYAWSFGNFIALFTLIWGFFAILSGSTMEAESLPLFLAFVIFLYLNYPGVRNQFVEAEMSRLTPEQRAAMQQLAVANATAAGVAVPMSPETMAAAAPAPAAAAAPAAPAPAPAAAAPPPASAAPPAEPPAAPPDASA
jgi:hypothetical protein